MMVKLRGLDAVPIIHRKRKSDEKSAVKKERKVESVEKRGKRKGKENRIIKIKVILTRTLRERKPKGIKICVVGNLFMWTLPMWAGMIG